MPEPTKKTSKRTPEVVSATAPEGHPGRVHRQLPVQPSPQKQLQQKHDQRVLDVDEQMTGMQVDWGTGGIPGIPADAPLFGTETQEYGTVDGTEAVMLTDPIGPPVSTAAIGPTAVGASATPGRQIPTGGKAVPAHRKAPQELVSRPVDPSRPIGRGNPPCGHSTASKANWHRTGTTRTVVIDDDQVERMARKGLTIAEIAAIYGVHHTTLTRHAKAAYERGHARLTADLRTVQVKKALQGDTIMLIWLGKNLLGQTDKVEARLEVGIGPVIWRDPDGNDLIFGASEGSATLMEDGDYAETPALD